MKILWGVIVLLVVGTGARADNPWNRLQGVYGSTRDAVFVRTTALPRSDSPAKPSDDPWRILQTRQVPFTEFEKEEAWIRSGGAPKVYGFLHEKLAPYRSIIRRSARLFDIPPQVIGAVIMVESSGNPRARAKTSSAKGLMQTIDGTFAEARKRLSSRGVEIENDPFDPRASILAGSWYLDRMFRQYEQDCGLRKNRDDLSAWSRAAEYYYAGPKHGRRRSPVVILHDGERKVVVEKAAYARKVMRWAEVMNNRHALLERRAFTGSHDREREEMLID